MKKLIYILLLSVIASPFFGQSGKVLEDLMNPLSVEIDNSQIYFTEGENIYIYSLNDLTLLKKFGKAGSGPQEFLVQPQVPLLLSVSRDYLIVNSQGKVSFWKKDGTYIRENKVQVGVFSGFFRPLSDGYVGLRIIIEDGIMYFGADYYDKDFKKIRLLFKQKHFFQQGKKMNPVGRIPFFSTWKGKAYIEDEHGVIHIFDKTGKEYPPVSHNFKPLKINSDHKKRILDFFKNDPGIKQLWNFFKDNLEFPKNFANIQNSIVVDDKIYMQTYRRDNGNVEFIIYNIDGKYIGTRMVPLKEMNIIRLYPYMISKGKFYQIFENEDEDWELSIIPIR